MIDTFRTTTALLASLSLLVPAPAVSQENGASAEEGELCADGSAPPCATEDGSEPTAEEDGPAADGGAEQSGEPGGDTTAEEGSGGDEAAVSEPVPTDGSDDAAAEEASGDSDAGASTGSDDQAQDFQGEAAGSAEGQEAGEGGSQAEDETAADTATSQAGADGSEADAEAASDGEADGAAASDDGGSSTAAEAGATETGGATSAEDGAATSADGGSAAGTAEDGAADESGDGDAADATGDGGQGEPTDDAAAASGDGVADDQDAPEAATGPAGDDGAGDPAATAGSDAEADAAERQTSGRSETEAGSGGGGAAASADQAESEPGDRDPAGAPAAAAREGEPEGEVTTETVTEENSRSSDEEFNTQMSTEPGARAEADDDGGFSNLEKALIVGAGALAVGSMLRGNREVVSTSADRVVVQREDGSYGILKDDNALLRRPGSEVRTETFDDGSTRTTVVQPDGSEIVTIRDAELRVLRRVRIGPDGSETVLIDDTGEVSPVDVASLPEPEPAPTVAGTNADALREALSRQATVDRSFSLAQVRDIRQVRRLAPAVELDSVTFDTGSAAIEPSEAEELSALGNLLADLIVGDPGEVFLVEGHTDAVGSAAMNLALSDRRAESVALALTEYFGVPPENMVVQGYGESDLRVETEAAERANRRATVRRITPLLRSASAR